jgi:two-component system LytT family response regulator
MPTNYDTIKALIVDDERLARLELRQVLAEFAHRISVVGEAASKSEAIEFIASSPDTVRPDVIFLDINMPHGSGFDVLTEIDYSDTSSIQIVFVTAYDEYAVRAFSVNALDYVLKPVDPERLERTLVRLEKKLERTPPVQSETLSKYAELGDTVFPTFNLTLDDYVYVTIGKQRRFVPVHEIVCITASDNYTELWMPDGKRAMLLRTMNEWEVMLPESDFLRIHRGTIINRFYVDASRPIEPSGSGTFVFLRDVAEPFAISRRSYTKLKEQLS